MPSTLTPPPGSGWPRAYTVPAVVLLALLALVGLLARRRRRPSPDFVRVFPPSRRHALQHLLRESAKTQRSSIPDDAPAPNVLQVQALPMAATPAHFRKGGLYTPTGFRLDEVASLGVFPDYAVLSGVRHPEPCGPNFDLSRACFRPFRPFRWGYHQTMAIMKLDPDYWIELEQNYVRSLQTRRELLEAHGEKILFHDPGSELACRELMEMVLQFVCRRYPQYFQLEAGDTVFVNRLLQTQTTLYLDDDDDEDDAAAATRHPRCCALHPLRVLFRHIPEDFAVMLRNERTGQYHLRAAAVCSSVGWHAGQKRGAPLGRIHEPVPDYAARMAASMDRFFARLPTDKPVQRGSWTVEAGAPFFAEQRPRGRGEGTTAEDVVLRCDWQTLRRLPLSGAVVFNFKAVFAPLAEVRREPFVPALLATVLREGREELVVHKALGEVRAAAVAACETWAREQVAQGVVPEGWEARTLDESPFYPGWEEKWHAKQGF